jgi:hypothetical protein
MLQRPLILVVARGVHPSQLALKCLSLRLRRNGKKRPVREALVGLLAGMFSHAEKAIPALTDVYELVAIEEEVNTRDVSSESRGAQSERMGVWQIHVAGPLSGDDFPVGRSEGDPASI